MKVIIAGSRGMTDYQLLEKECDAFLEGIEDIEIVSGRCSVGKLTFLAKDGTYVYGADGLGEQYAEQRKLNVKPFPADWKKYGLAAGPMRNEEMAEYGDMLIAFTTKNSRGTQNMIKMAKKYGLKTKIVEL